MKVSKVIIEEKDLEKLLRESGYRSLRQLAKTAGVDYMYLWQVSKGRHIMSEQIWDRIKNVL